MVHQFFLGSLILCIMDTLPFYHLVLNFSLSIPIYLNHQYHWVKILEKSTKFVFITLCPSIVNDGVAMIDKFLVIHHLLELIIPNDTY